MKRNNQNRGFTIVELLTVMGVIALLIGLLVPALTMVRRKAKDVKQNAQFHSISVALEMFKNDEGDYPDSSQVPGGGTVICGGQRLAEALVGRDLQGFDPHSLWHPDLDRTSNPPDNAYSTDATGNPSQQQQSLGRRRGPYLNLQNTGAFSPYQLFDASNISAASIYGGDVAGLYPAPMLTDIYTVKNVSYQTTTGGVTTTTTVKAGTPILYYRANVSATSFEWQTLSNLSLCIYNYNDNGPIIDLGKMTNQALTPNPHPFYDTSGSGRQPQFYNKITNPAITTTPRPYNQDSFILLSAGNDGLYGTSDDIWNFGD